MCGEQMIMRMRRKRGTFLIIPFRGGVCGQAVLIFYSYDIVRKVKAYFSYNIITQAVLIRIEDENMLVWMRLQYDP